MSKIRIKGEMNHTFWDCVTSPYREELHMLLLIAESRCFTIMVAQIVIVECYIMTMMGTRPL